MGCSDRDHVFAEDIPLGFSGDIKDIMAQFCFECHGVENTESGLDLRTIESMLKGGESGPVLVPGKPEENHGYLWISFNPLPSRVHNNNCDSLSHL